MFWSPLILGGSVIFAGTVHDFRRVKVPGTGPLWNPWRVRKEIQHYQCLLDIFIQIVKICTLLPCWYFYTTELCHHYILQHHIVSISVNRKYQLTACPKNNPAIMPMFPITWSYIICYNAPSSLNRKYLLTICPLSYWQLEYGAWMREFSNWRDH
jgi:hypothetical protein